jgi:hypothetical protein
MTENGSNNAHQSTNQQALTVSHPRRLCYAPVSRKLTPREVVPREAWSNVSARFC